MVFQGGFMVFHGLQVEVFKLTTSFLGQEAVAELEAGLATLLEMFPLSCRVEAAHCLTLVSAQCLIASPWSILVILMFSRISFHCHCHTVTVPVHTHHGDVIIIIITVVVSFQG